MTVIKMLLTLALTLLAAQALDPGLAFADGAACQSLVITGHPSYPPVAWAEQGKIVGAAPDLVVSIARSLGVKQVVSKDFGSWEAAQQASRNGDADVIFGIYKNDERVTYLNYIEPPFMLDPVSIVVRQGTRFPFGQWSDLKGRKGVTNAGESYGNKFDDYMARSLTVARAPGVDPAFDSLLRGEADYLIIGLYPGENVARRLGITRKVSFLAKPVDAADMFIAFAKKSKCYGPLKAGFAAGIKAAVKDGKVKALLTAALARYHP